MFKSSSEQLQIRKKRKISSVNQTVARYIKSLPLHAFQPRLHPKPPGVKRSPVVKQFYDPGLYITPKADNCRSKNPKCSSCSCLCDQRQQQQQQQQPKDMPLSQGYPQQSNNNKYHQNGNSYDNKYNVPAPANKRRTLVAGAVRPTDAKRKLSSENLQHSRANVLAKGASANHGSSNNSKLQLSYLLGESLARCGRLQEAFDIYAIIAHGDLEGYIPLDRLNTLATCLIGYLKQQQQQQLPQNSEQQKQSYLAAGSKIAWDSNLKTKFAKHAASARRNTLKHVTEAAAAAASLKRDSEILNMPVAAGNYGNLTVVGFDRDGSVDPLLCPVCQDILRCPVTMNCGHTFCRQCCEAIAMCNICEVKFPRFNFDDHVVNRKPLQDSFHGNHYAINPTTTSSSLSPPPANCSFFSEIHNNNSSNNNSNNSNNNSNNNSSNNNSSSNNSSNNSSSNNSNSNNSSNNINNNNSSSSSSNNNNTSLDSPQMTVTTTTVASTTSTATTTMAASFSVPFTNYSLAAGKDRSMRFMPDVLVRRLVEKWWGADLQAKKINDTAASYMHLNLLDDALKFCNASLEKSPMNFKSLLLRAEVLRKLNHFQSSLADIDSALKSRYTSAKAYYQRSLTLTELGRLDEALHDICLAVSLDRSRNLTMSELFQHDLAKLLQKWLAQVPKHSLTSSHREFTTNAPYNILSEHRLRRRQIGLLSSVNGDHLRSPHEEGDGCGIKRCEELIAAEEVEHALVAMGHYISPRTDLYANISTDYELALQRQSYRKHCRRKWIRQETELMPSDLLYEGRCSELFRNVLSRSLLELQRLIKLESTDEAQQSKLIPVNPTLVDASDFDCVLCCRTFWKPVVTPCGHTYCWVCLDRCMDYTSSCPLCMSPLVEPLNINAHPPGSSSPVPFVLAKRPVTKFLEAAMKRFIPESYARRFHQEMDLEPSVPVFICTAAFPHVACPLFVYEPRYRLMVRRAVESGEKQFGIVQPHSGKSRYFDVGTILDIRDCVLLGDGCTILSTIGCKRFKILARNEKDGYETAKVEYIYDETITDEHVATVSGMHAAVLHKANEWIDSLSKDLKQEIVQSFGEMPVLENNWERMADGPAWAWWIIALLPLSQQLKVDILATTSLEKRLRAIEKTLDYMLGSFRRSAQHSCSVVVQQQHHQHQQHQQQQQQHQQCDNELAPNCQSEEFCLATNATLAPNSETHAHNSEPHTQLLL